MNNKGGLLILAMILLVMCGLFVFYRKQEENKQPINVDVKPQNIEIKNTVPEVPPLEKPPEEKPKEKGQIRVWPFFKMEWDKDQKN